MLKDLKPYKVIPIVRFGMLFGYGVYETATCKVILEYNEDEKHLAESKVELKNALKGY